MEDRGSDVGPRAEPRAIGDEAQWVEGGSSRGWACELYKADGGEAGRHWRKNEWGGGQRVEEEDQGRRKKE